MKMLAKPNSRPPSGKIAKKPEAEVKPSNETSSTDPHEAQPMPRKLPAIPKMLMPAAFWTLARCRSKNTNSAILIPVKKLVINVINCSTVERFV
ncbi:MAG: hypothetical protein A3D39_01205 [Candidatus Buchananbacteria bacterium RIFCSPHIGHO2_02_FULL_39_17]|nr:MAG: hypothetical protein A3D39_01205 [Candidatus Buchananbacteria bacterium RIFCSPHIGHO2_02_FULL_39_17]